METFTTSAEGAYAHRSDSSPSFTTECQFRMVLLAAKECAAGILNIEETEDIYISLNSYLQQSSMSSTGERGGNALIYKRPASIQSML